MAYKLDYAKVDKSKLNVFSEGRKRRVFVGALSWDKTKIVLSSNIILNILNQKRLFLLERNLIYLNKYIHQMGSFSSSFSDRIPSKENPAYGDYCHSQGMSVSETNPIILLISIGKRGPSTFIFEPIFTNTFEYKQIRKFRKSLQLSIHDFAEALESDVL